MWRIVCLTYTVKLWNDRWIRCRLHTYLSLYNAANLQLKHWRFFFFFSVNLVVTAAPLIGCIAVDILTNVSKILLQLSNSRCSWRTADACVGSHSRMWSPGRRTWSEQLCLRTSSQTSLQQGHVYRALNRNLSSPLLFFLCNYFRELFPICCWWLQMKY